ncbi:hypothetical protein EVAR_13101_1 [Eumeta japonica]|uniref:Uncharacterized protein n=1 Tax=Eumeta variegata TaxID=151549 RepID=A0A4C1U9M5_EUMVA|nr:hypothetical protein EVAR_13101_1 [Eumeta japonica]
MENVYLQEEDSGRTQGGSSCPPLLDPGSLATPLLRRTHPQAVYIVLRSLYLDPTALTTADRELLTYVVTDTMYGVNGVNLA